MGLWDDVVSTTKKGVDIVGETAGDLLDKGKSVANVEKCKYNLKKAQQKLGEITYSAKRTGVENEQVINQCLAEIDTLLDQLRKLRGTEAADSFCPKCGSACKGYSNYCANCGSPLQKQEGE